MPGDDEMRDKLWKAIKSDRTMMLGLVGVDESHTRPMTGLLDGDEGPIWFFSSTETELVRQVGQDSRALASFADKGHDLFACLHGRLNHETDRGMVDRLWNPFIAAWYERGKEDPKLALLRFDAEEAQIWIDASSVLSGIKLLLGVNPKKSYRDKVAEVKL